MKKAAAALALPNSELQVIVFFWLPAARLDNENIKFSVLIGSPNLCAVRIGDFSGILEYVWEWPSEKYPDNYRIQAPKELIEEEYYSRFMKGLWVVPDRTEEEVTVAAIAAGKARFEFGEKPDV